MAGAGSNVGESDLVLHTMGVLCCVLILANLFSSSSVKRHLKSAKLEVGKPSRK